MFFSNSNFENDLLRNVETIFDGCKHKLTLHDKTSYEVCFLDRRRCTRYFLKYLNCIDLKLLLAGIDSANSQVILIPCSVLLLKFNENKQN